MTDADASSPQVERSELVEMLCSLPLRSEIRLECADDGLTIEGRVSSLKALAFDEDGEIRMINLRTEDVPEPFSSARIDLHEGREDPDLPEVELRGIGYNDNNDRFQRSLGEVSHIERIGTLNDSTRPGMPSKIPSPERTTRNTTQREQNMDKNDKSGEIEQLKGDRYTIPFLVGGILILPHVLSPGLYKEWTLALGFLLIIYAMWGRYVRSEDDNGS